MEASADATFNEGGLEWHKALDNASGSPGCLPVKEAECADDGSGNCYATVPLEVQYGCGGIRARISECDNEISPLFGKKGEHSRPGLVKAR